MASLAVRCRDGQTVIDDLYQHANAKLRIPKTGAGPLEAVFINTAGGIAGGDTLKLSAQAKAGSRLVVSTQACERLYRSADGAPCHINNQLMVERDAFAAWMPQETIAFDRSAMRRNLDVDLAEGASCLIHETIVFGRALMGETVGSVSIDDHWTVRRAGRLMHAERLHIAGLFDKTLNAKAALDGRTVSTTLLWVPPEGGEALIALRDRLLKQADNDNVLIGISAFEDKLVCRLLSKNTRALRAVLPELVRAMKPGLELPKVWRL